MLAQGGLTSRQHSGCLVAAAHKQATTLPLPQAHPALSIPILCCDGPPGDFKTRSHWGPTTAGDNPHHKEAMQQDNNSDSKDLQLWQLLSPLHPHVVQKQQGCRGSSRHCGEGKASSRVLQYLIPVLTPYWA